MREIPTKPPLLEKRFGNELSCIYPLLGFTVYFDLVTERCRSRAITILTMLLLVTIIISLGWMLSGSLNWNSWDEFMKELNATFANTTNNSNGNGTSIRDRFLLQYTESKAEVNNNDNQTTQLSVKVVEILNKWAIFILGLLILAGNSEYQSIYLSVVSFLISGFCAWSYIQTAISNNFDNHTFLYCNTIIQGVICSLVALLYIELLIRHLLKRNRSYMVDRLEKQLAYTYYQLKNPVHRSSVNGSITILEQRDSYEISHNSYDNNNQSSSDNEEDYESQALLQQYAGEEADTMNHNDNNNNYSVNNTFQIASSESDYEEEIEQERRHSSTRAKIMATFLGNFPQFFAKLGRSCKQWFLSVIINFRTPKGFRQEREKALSEAFQYPLRLWIAFASSIYVSLVASLWLVMVLKFIVDAFSALMGDMLHHKTISLIHSIVLYVTPSICGLAFIGLMINWTLLLRHYRSGILKLRRGSPHHFNKRNYTLLDATKYIGYQVCHSLVGFIILFIFWFILSIIILICVLAPSVRMSILVFVFKMVATYLISSVLMRGIYIWIFSTDSGRLLRHFRVFMLLDYINVTISSFIGVMVCATRAVMAIGFALLSFSRLDVPLMSHSFETFDAGYSAFLSMLRMDYQHSNNPIALTFAHLLVLTVLEKRKRKQDEDLQPGDILDKGSLRSRKIQNKWWLLVVLSRNRSLVALRQHNIPVKQKKWFAFISKSSNK